MCTLALPCSSRKGTSEAAAAIVKEAEAHAQVAAYSAGAAGLKGSTFVRDMQQLQRLRAAAANTQAKALAAVLVAGVGFHNAAMEPADRALVEELFKANDLAVREQNGCSSQHLLDAGRKDSEAAPQGPGWVFAKRKRLKHCRAIATLWKAKLMAIRHLTSLQASALARFQQLYVAVSHAGPVHDKHLGHGCQPAGTLGGAQGDCPLGWGHRGNARGAAGVQGVLTDRGELRVATFATSYTHIMYTHIM